MWNFKQLYNPTLFQFVVSLSSISIKIREVSILAPNTVLKRGQICGFQFWNVYYHAISNYLQLDVFIPNSDTGCCFKPFALLYDGSWLGRNKMQFLWILLFKNVYKEASDLPLKWDDVSNNSKKEILTDDLATRSHNKECIII